MNDDQDPESWQVWWWCTLAAFVIFISVYAYNTVIETAEKSTLYENIINDR